LRATLDQVPEDSRVTVCEVFATVLAWNRDYLADLAHKPLEDSRLEVHCVDVWCLLDRPEPFDAIVLDVDNGPRAMTLRSNERLYQPEGLARLARSLTAAGRLAIWSSGAAPGFKHRLHRAGFDVRTEQVPVRDRSGLSHTIFVAVPECRRAN
jgi:spermidine synthase